MKQDVILVKGSVIQSFRNICISLKFITENTLFEQVTKVNDPNDWYPFTILENLFKVISDSYQNPESIFEMIGAETMKIWYEQGEGEKLISSGLDFLNFQEGSKGYFSMIKGSPEQIGKFYIESINTEKCEAVIFDSTPFHPAFTKGLITAGITFPGDIIDVNVEYHDNYRFFIKFRQAD